MNRQIVANTLFILLAAIDLFIGWRYEELYWICLLILLPLILMWGLIYGMGKTSDAYVLEGEA